jgi:hypothetical protein
MEKRLEDRLGNYCEGEWYEFSHIHPSLEGIKERNLKTIMEIEQFIGERLDSRKLIHQRWISIDLNNSDYDGIFVHTNNPNQKNYPTEFEKGRITKTNAKKYTAILNVLSKNGYMAFKTLGHPTIIAIKNASINENRNSE